MKIFKIGAAEAGQRLDIFLAGVLDISRSQIQKLVEQEFIVVDERKVRAHYKIKDGETITVKREEAEIRTPKVITREEDLPEVDILEETDNYLIINKPAGLTVHGTKFVRGKTLVDVLLAKFPDLRKIGEDPDRPAIVHRLDREVSGLMIIPKTQDFFDHVKKQFQDRTIKKEYLALVYDKTSKDRDEIHFPIRRSSERKKMAAIPETKNGKKNLDGKRAISSFEVMQRLINYTLIRVIIKTGRTHQIRVHLTAYGHPLVGDNLYSTKRSREKNAKLGLKRVFLVADTLRFTDLDGETREYKIELPEDLQKLLSKVK